MRLVTSTEIETKLSFPYFNLINPLAFLECGLVDIKSNISGFLTE